MSYIVNSIPKSGTYLVEKFLSNCGVPASGLHFRNGLLWVFTGAALENIIEDPSQFKIAEPLSQSLDRLAPGKSAVAHLFDPYKCIPLMEGRGIRFIFLVRNLEDCLISSMRFVSNPKRRGHLVWSKNEMTKAEQFIEYLETRGASYFGTMKRQLAWLETDCPLVRFEDLVGDFGPTKKAEAVATIVRAFDLQVSESEALDGLSAAIGTPTRTFSGRRSSPEEFMSAEARAILNRIGVPEANRRLGY